MITCPICNDPNCLPKYFPPYYSYYECRNCGVLFLYPKPEEHEIKKYYQKNFEYTAGRSEENRIRLRSRKILKKLNELHPSGRSILDIGSGYGYFLDEARKSGLNTIGIEPSKALHVSSKKYLDGFVFHTDLIEFVETQKRKFDFITLIHVIEHVTDPKLFIETASKLLNKNGILYIETPNIKSHLASIEKEHYTFLTPPDHIWLFSPESLSMICSIPDFRIQELSTYSYPEHFMGIIKRKSQVIKPISQIVNSRKSVQSITQKFKYLFFDRFLAPIFSPLLDIGQKGSILELYIRKQK